MVKVDRYLVAGLSGSIAALGVSLAASARAQAPSPPENQPPTADFTFTPTNPDVGQTVSFDGAPSSDPDGSITAYEWAFHDGTTAVGQTASFTYSSEGDFDVALTVTDDGGASDTMTMTVTVGGTATDEAFYGGGEFGDDGYAGEGTTAGVSRSPVATT